MLRRTLANQRTFLLSLAAAVIVFILWNVSGLDFILYPFRLFVTYVHEAGHGSAAILTGGHLVSFQIFADGSGVANTIGGTRALVIPAGYLGAALFGAVVFYLTNRLRTPRSIAVVLGLLLMVFSVLFGLSSPTAFAVGMIFGAALIIIGWKFNRAITTVILDVLAIITGLNAVLDVYYLIGNSQIGLGNIPNDAAAFQAEITPVIPAALIALIWVLIAVALLGASVWFAILRPMRRKHLI
ncbi:MAG: M50 family metallopeptidase [Anaerolineaceae bacterium]|nr:M50 family metallopeptidase [Anaerolineaceae bacterium]